MAGSTRIRATVEVSIEMVVVTNRPLMPCQRHFGMLFQVSKHTQNVCGRQLGGGFLVERTIPNETKE